MTSGNFGFKTLWTDPEIIGKTFLQLQHLSFNTFIDNTQQKPFFDKASSVMHKLHATKYHLENYRRIEQEHLAKCEIRFKQNPNDTYECFELIFEMEAFLFQIKSSLDMLVKLLPPIIGAGKVKVQTFKDKGNHLITGLAQYKKENNVRVEYVDEIIRLTKQMQDDWLDLVIDLRDTLYHYKALVGYAFTCNVAADGNITIQKPRFSLQQEALDFMETVYKCNLDFHQCFMSLALGLKAPKPISLGLQDPIQAEQMYGEPGKYIRFYWGHNTPQILTQ